MLNFALMFELMPAAWRTLLSEELQKPYIGPLQDFVEREYATTVCYPPRQQVFRAFELCPPGRVKAVILGQDPYHEEGQAQGLCFSVAPGVKIPPSLRNIFKELHADTGAPVPESGDLTRWASQGVLLLNATLTVRAHRAGSHSRKGWETLTDAVIRAVSSRQPHVVFLLWGNYAAQKAPLIDPAKHLILQSPHPSPLSAWQGFFGNRHFSRANEFLTKNGLEPIEW